MYDYKFNTIEGLISLQEELNRIFEEIEKSLITEEKSWEHSYFWKPIIDGCEDEEKFTFFIELPGVSLKDVELHLDGSSLIVSGERKLPFEEKGDEYFLRSECNYGPFRRIIRIKEPFKEDKIDASLKNGILTIKVYKK